MKLKSAIIASFVGPVMAKVSLRLLLLVGAVLSVAGYLLLAFGVVGWLRGRKSSYQATQAAFHQVMAMLVVQMALGIATVLTVAQVHVAISARLHPRVHLHLHRTIKRERVQPHTESNVRGSRRCGRKRREGGDGGGGIKDLLRAVVLTFHERSAHHFHLDAGGPIPANQVANACTVIGVVPGLDLRLDPDELLLDQRDGLANGGHGGLPTGLSSVHPTIGIGPMTDKVPKIALM